MITDFLMTALFSALDAVLGLMPTWTPPSAPSFDGWAYVALAADHYFPMATLAAVLLLVLATDFLLLLWDAGVWVYHQIWGSS